MEDRRGRSGGTTAATRPSGDANGTLFRNLQMQALLGFNAERLNQLKGFVEDKGPELLGDLFCPWAKWALILLNSLVQSDTDGSLQRYIARIFGMQSPHPVKSPLQTVVSTLHAASEEALQDAQFMTNLRTGAVAACRAILLMLIMAIADLGWKGLVCFHVGLVVARMNLPFSEKDHDLLFQAVHVFLYALHAVAPTLYCQFLLPVVGSVFAVSLQSLSMNLDMSGFMFLTSAFVIFFLTPVWFGVCVLFAIFVRISASDGDQSFSAFMCICFCGIRLGAYASGGAFGVALLAFLCPIVLLSCREDLHGFMWTPLPLVLALMSCLFTSFQIGLFFTSMLVFFLAAANDNAKAIVWWFVSFSALHLLAYAFSQNFSFIVVCFIGSYFSYGCIL